MSILSIDQQYEFGAKIQNLIMFVGLLTEDEIETLHELRKNLVSQNSTLGAASGTLIPLEKADHKIARHNAMIKRLDAIIAIHESNLEMEDADISFKEAQEGRRKINELFGLDND